MVDHLFYAFGHNCMPHKFAPLWRRRNDLLRHISLHFSFTDNVMSSSGKLYVSRPILNTIFCTGPSCGWIYNLNHDDSDLLILLLIDPTSSRTSIALPTLTSVSTSYVDEFQVLMRQLSFPCADISHWCFRQFQVCIFFQGWFQTTNVSGRSEC